MRVGVTGHQHLPPDVQDYVREAVAGALAAVPGLVGVTSLAAGADQLFASAVRQRGGRLHVVLPSRNYESSFTSAADLAGYRRLLAGAETVETLDYESPSEAAYLAAGRRVVDLAEGLVAVWDGEPARGAGGTADVVAYARGRGLPVQVVWPPGAAR